MASTLDSEGFYSDVGGVTLDGGRMGEQAQWNAQRLAYILEKDYNWSIDAISAWFSAITYESGFNPGCCEGGVYPPTRSTGVGLVQWTPSTNLIDFTNEWGVYWYLVSSQCRKFELERTTTDSNIKQWFVMEPYYSFYMDNIGTGREPCRTFDEFTHATLTEYSMLELCAMIPEFYTRPASWDSTDNWYRNAEAGNFWYNALTGELPPTPPGPRPDPFPKPILRYGKIPWFYTSGGYNVYRR